MNKLNKILIFIIILLVISLITSIFFCFKYINLTLTNNGHLTEVIKAIENKGLEAQKQNDGSIILVERENPVERVID